MMAEIVQSSSHPIKCSKNYVVWNGGKRNNDKNIYKEDYFPHMNELRISNLDFRQLVDHHQSTLVTSMSTNFSNTVSDPDMKYSY